jgi:nucleotide-binding universal stress UspA family protein
MIEIRTILCPVDFSPGASAATEYAVSLAEKLGARVHLLHVYPLPMLAAPDGGLMVTPEMVTRMSTESERAISEVAARYEGRGVEIETHVRDGAPYSEILRRAEQVGADLIVMGTHGRSGIAHLLLGSVAEKVVRSSLIPVLTVRSERPD